MDRLKRRIRFKLCSKVIKLFLLSEWILGTNIFPKKSVYSFINSVPNLIVSLTALCSIDSYNRHCKYNLESAADTLVPKYAPHNHEMILNCGKSYYKTSVARLEHTI